MTRQQRDYINCMRIGGQLAASEEEAFESAFERGAQVARAFMGGMVKGYAISGAERGAAQAEQMIGGCQ